MLSRLRARLESNMTPVFAEILDGDLDSLTVKKLFAAVTRKDEAALAVIRETAEYLGIGLAGVVNLLNPEIVVVGGGIADGSPEFVDLIASEIRRRAFDSATANLRVARAALGNDAGFIGAGMLGDL
jgi:glucokinase